MLVPNVDVVKVSFCFFFVPSLVVFLPLLVAGSGLLGVVGVVGVMGIVTSFSNFFFLNIYFLFFKFILIV